MSDSPRLSVVMPVYGTDPGYLRDAIKSVVDQTFRDFELIVVEDESPRRAAPVVEEIGDPRVRHYMNPRRNKLGAALNFGIAQARAPLIARMDGDDLCEPNRFALQTAAFEADPKLDVLGSQIAVIDSAGAPVGFRVYPQANDDIVRTLRRYNCISHPSVVFRRATVRDIGGYGEGIVHEDYDLWCRLAKAGAKIENRPERLVRYRFHAESTKLSDIRVMLIETIKIKERYFAGELDPLDRARILGEWALTLVPGAWVVRLFGALEYHQLFGKADRSRS
jgi:glycosyltransferase involved in cell wall biosynthesis